MNLEAVTRPMERVREQVVRLGAQWAKQGRHVSEVALRNGASALSRTAVRLDTLADRIADAPAVAVPAVEATNAAAPEPVVEASAAVEESAAVEAIAVAAPPEPVVEASAAVAQPEPVLAEPSHGASTPAARVPDARDASKKKHRRQHRAAR